MSFESHQEDEVERQVNEIFEDVSDKTVQERMVMTAFDLLAFIDEERQAEIDVFKSWIEHGKANHTRRSTLLSSFGAAIITGFQGFGGWSISVHSPLQAMSEPRVPQPHPEPSEASLKEARFDEARRHLESARGIVSDIYRLTPKQVKKAEAIARQRKLPAGL